MTSPIADMVQRMLAAGTAAELIVLAIRTAETSVRPSYDASSESADSSSDAAADRRRAYDREYQRNRRKTLAELKALAEANDAANVVNPSADASSDSADERCDLSSFLSSSESGTRKGRKKEEGVRARGTRLTAGQPIAAADFEFARSLDHAPAVIAAMWVEFVDYWIGIPGQRGTKLDWPATWRNRVREIGKRTRGVNGQQPNAVMAAFDRGIAATESCELQGDFELRDITPGGVQGR